MKKIILSGKDKKSIMLDCLVPGDLFIKVKKDKILYSAIVIKNNSSTKIIDVLFLRHVFDFFKMKRFGLDICLDTMPEKDFVFKVLKK